MHPKPESRLRAVPKHGKPPSVNNGSRALNPNPQKRSPWGLACCFWFKVIQPRRGILVTSIVLCP